MGCLVRQLSHSQQEEERRRGEEMRGEEEEEEDGLCGGCKWVTHANPRPSEIRLSSLSAPLRRTHSAIGAASLASTPSPPRHAILFPTN